MLTRDFDYDLPAEAIAQRPAPRGESRLLVLDAEGSGRHRRVRDLPELLEPGDLVVVNDTRVIPARLYARRIQGGGRVELLLVEKVGEREWDALAKPGKKARPGTELDLGEGLTAVTAGRPAAGGASKPSSGSGTGSDADTGTESAAAPDTEAGAASAAPPALPEGDGRLRVVFSEPVEPHLERLGHVPLPPYIKRPDEAADRERYQTVYAKSPGAIAAPTAGLHFDRALLAAIEARGAAVVPITLHVGIGTFKPVTAALVHEHRMETERYDVPAATAEAIARTRACGGRIVAIGTTVVRALEGAADAGAGTVQPGPGRTDLFITPGYRFRVADVLLTNFHLPCSTLLMLVSAFAGRERVMAAYREAVAEGYRFYSYGDAMLCEREQDSPISSATSSTRAGRQAAPGSVSSTPRGLRSASAQAPCGRPAAVPARAAPRDARRGGTPMKDMMEHKGYYGSVSCDDDDRTFYGKLEFIRGLISYEGRDVTSLRAAFEEAVEDYLALCSETGREPDRPFKGSFNVRVGKELHRQAALAAKERGMSLNAFVTEALGAASRRARSQG